MLHKNTKLTTLIPTFCHVGAEHFAYGFCLDQRKYPSTLRKLAKKEGVLPSLLLVDFFPGCYWCRPSLARLEVGPDRLRLERVGVGTNICRWRRCRRRRSRWWSHRGVGRAHPGRRGLVAWLLRLVRSGAAVAAGGVLFVPFTNDSFVVWRAVCWPLAEKVFNVMMTHVRTNVLDKGLIAF